MTLAAAAAVAKSVDKLSSLITWQSTGRLQQTIAGTIRKTGVGLHSGKVTTVKIFPEFATRGRYFKFNSQLIDASIDFVEPSPLCTTLCRDGHRIRTVEHLLSALEGMGVDNCRIEIENSDGDDDAVDDAVEVPILDGSALEWVEAIQQVGLKAALDDCGCRHAKMAPFVHHQVGVTRNGSSMALDYDRRQQVRISCEINFSQVPAIGVQRIADATIGGDYYAKEIAPARTFCIFEEVEKLHNAGLVKGGSTENAIICSADKGWLNPPLRFDDEPCRHKILDIIGDLSLFARCGSQGLPVASLVAYKSGHALHADIVRSLTQSEGKVLSPFEPFER